MTRIRQQRVHIPDNVEVSLNGSTLSIKGPLGELSRKFREEIEVDVLADQISLKPVEDSLFSKALLGTYASHIKNMVQGVIVGYEKKLEISGVGYKAALEEKNLVLNIGFSHPVKIEIPEGIKISLEKNIIIVSGIDKEKVGYLSGKIRATKKPEPYKGKGIKYAEEIIKRKQGKKAVT